MYTRIQLTLILFIFLSTNSFASLLGFEEDCTQYQTPVSSFVSNQANTIKVGQAIIDINNLAPEEVEEWLWIREAAKLELPYLKVYRDGLRLLAGNLKKIGFKNKAALNDSQVVVYIDTLNSLGEIRKQILKNKIKINRTFRGGHLKVSSEDKIKLRKQNEKLNKVEIVILGTFPLLAHPKLQKFIERVVDGEIFDLENYSMKEDYFLWTLRKIVKDSLKDLDLQITKFANIANSKVSVRDTIHKTFEFSDLYSQWGIFSQLLLSEQTNPVAILGANSLISANCRLKNRLFEHKAKLVIADSLFDLATLIPLIRAGRILTAGIKKFGIFGAYLSRSMLPIIVLDSLILYIDKKRLDTISNECRDIRLQIAVLGTERQSELNACISERNSYILKAAIAALGGMSVNIRYTLKSLKALNL